MLSGNSDKGRFWNFDKFTCVFKKDKVFASLMLYVKEDGINIYFWFFRSFFTDLIN